MPAPILPISPGSLGATAATSKLAAPSSGGGFQEVFNGALRTVESFQQNASGSIERLLSGETEELHTTIMAAQRAELSFDLFLQVRNKVVSAYQEIMRMQI